MLFRSTNNHIQPVDFEEAITSGLAQDEGLFMPFEIPRLEGWSKMLQSLSGRELAFNMLQPFVEDSIPEDDLRTIVEETFLFDIPLVRIEEKIWALELFHGPTLAFKDVGARFLARCLEYLLPPDEKLTVLVATSGDTGSAVAHGFSGLSQVEVVLLYPSGKVSNIQEKQLTTAGENVTALQVAGDFDDCQKMVKQAFGDKELRGEKNITSANSINIARWLPQSVYYAMGVAQLPMSNQPLAISVPSGNYGNLTAGLLACKMGLPVDQFIAASNRNSTVPEYLETGKYKPRPSQETLSNAMDVGDPSNFARLTDLFSGDYEALTEILTGYSYSDEETMKAIAQIYKSTGYMADPHGAIGYLGLKEFLDHHSVEKWRGIFLETAHPSKFHETVGRAVQKEVTMPQRLAACLSKSSHSIRISPDYAQLRKFLLHRAD